MFFSKTTIIKPIPRMLALVGPFQRFSRKVATGGFLLFAATVIALLWANLKRGH